MSQLTWLKCPKSWRLLYTMAIFPCLLEGKASVESRLEISCSSQYTPMMQSFSTNPAARCIGSLSNRRRCHPERGIVRRLASLKNTSVTHIDHAFLQKSNWSLFHMLFGPRISFCPLTASRVGDTICTGTGTLQIQPRQSPWREKTNQLSPL